MILKRNITFEKNKKHLQSKKSELTFVNISLFVIFVMAKSVELKKITNLKDIKSKNTIKLIMKCLHITSRHFSGMLQSEYSSDPLNSYKNTRNSAYLKVK